LRRSYLSQEDVFVIFDAKIAPAAVALLALG